MTHHVCHSKAPPRPPITQGARTFGLLVFIGVFMTFHWYMIVPLVRGWITSSASLGQDPSSFLFTGLLFIVASAIIGLLTSLIFGAAKNPVAICAVFLTVIFGSLVSSYQLAQSKEISMLHAYISAKKNVDIATYTLGHAPANASTLNIPSLKFALEEPFMIKSLASIDASPASVSNAMMVINSTGDNSDSAKYVRENAMVREYDKEYFAKISMLTSKNVEK